MLRRIVCKTTMKVHVYAGIHFIREYTMKILYVVNNAFVSGNGLSNSCRRAVRYLCEAGEDVRILSARGSYGGEPDFALETGTLPLFHRLVDQQGYIFARSDDDMIRRAVEWADIVHLEEPFYLQLRACAIARDRGKTLTATYHVHPENLFSSVHLGSDRVLNSLTLKLWIRTMYNRCSIVQCPTQNVRERLEKYGCTTELRIISNGMIACEGLPVPSPVQKREGTFIIIATGRYSQEKDQSTLLRAMRFSKYAHRIQLVFAGQGPLENKLRAQAQQLYDEGVLGVEPIFDFYDAAQLHALYAQADLYVHCALIEVEGLSCMEAIHDGVVPVIAQGELTATSQFALCAHSLFPQRDAFALAQRIDYWLTNDNRRRLQANAYRQSSRDYDMCMSVRALQKMYRDALEKSR